MSEVKFTPGPWHPGHFGSDSKCQCRSVISENYMGCIATIEVDNGMAFSDGGNDAPPVSEAVANMHLIAAAPELYELLRQTEAMFDMHKGIDEEEFIYRQDVRAALSKARGETL